MAVEHLCRNSDRNAKNQVQRVFYYAVSLVAAALLRNNRLSVSRSSSVLARMPAPPTISISSNVLRSLLGYFVTFLLLPRLTLDLDRGS